MLHWDVPASLSPSLNSPFIPKHKYNFPMLSICLFFFQTLAVSFSSRTLRSPADHYRGNDVINCSLVIEIDSWHCYSMDRGTVVGQHVTAAWLLDFIPRKSQRREERGFSDRNMQISVGASSELCQKGDESFHGEEKTSEGEGNGELISLTPDSALWSCWMLVSVLFFLFTHTWVFFSFCRDFLSTHNSFWNRCCSWNCSILCQTLLDTTAVTPGWKC